MPRGNVRDTGKALVLPTDERSTRQFLRRYAVYLKRVTLCGRTVGAGAPAREPVDMQISRMTRSFIRYCAVQNTDCTNRIGHCELA